MIVVPKLDVLAVIKAFGGINALVTTAERHGLPGYSSKLIEKWRERKTISMSRWLELTALAQAENKSLNLSNFLTYEAQDGPV